MLGRGTTSGELAVQTHAADEEREAVADDLIPELGADALLEQADGVRHDERQGEEEHAAPVPAVAVEADDEGDEVQAQR